MDYQVVRVVEALCNDVGTPLSKRVLTHVQKGEWLELQQLKVRPANYEDSESYWKDALVVDLLRKCDLPTTVDKRAVAVETFWKCERQNSATNARLTRFLSNSLLIEDAQEEAVYRFIIEWRKEVDFVMGNLPDTLTPRFSSGATYADTGLLITTPDKMSSRPTITPGARCLLPLWGETAWSRQLVRARPWQSDPRTVRGNIFFCVPKDGKTFRGCAKEASVNIGYQLDVGRLLKDRLLRIGIDLRRGQDVHRLLAKQASMDSQSATIDMSNASDLLARVLPKLVCRADWHALLDSLRATHTNVFGKLVRLEKFSSMGNGFTFELETIIFATMARTVIRLSGGDPGSVTCYGDDLIVPSNHYREVIAALRLFGFTPNMDKTFAEGPFRESCGGDFWSGTPVRAHFIEELPDEPQKWISLANGLRRVCHDSSGLSPTRWGMVRRAWFRALDPIPTNIRRCRGPETLGDLVIHDTQENWGWTTPPDDLPQGGESGVYVSAYMPIHVVLPWHHWLPEVQFACCTLGLPSTGILPRKDDHKSISGYRIGRVPAYRSSWLPIGESRKSSRHPTWEGSVTHV